MLKKAFLGLITVFASLVVIAPAVSASSVNNFLISSYDIDYHLGLDDENRSTLLTKETITADFSQPNQNHGIERAIPTSYDGHATSLEIRSVKDELGKNWKYSTNSDSGLNVLRIDDPGEYVYGKKTFVIEYMQRDVTKSFGANKGDEFYWDTNGTDWKVPIQNLSVRLDIDSKLAAKLSGNVSCYQGKFGGNQQCDLTKDGTTYKVSATNLSIGENVTIAVGFQPNTFAAYQMSNQEKLIGTWVAIQGVLLIIGVGFILWLSVRYYRQTNRGSEHDPIVPEYIPPKDASVETSASVMAISNSLTAQLIDLAVRHYLKIYQTKKGKWIFSHSEYEIEIVRSIDDLRAEEKEIISDIFNGAVTVGSRLEMKKLRNDTKLAARMLDNPKRLKDLMQGEYGLRHKVPEQSEWFKSFGKRMLIPAVLLLSPVFLVVSIVSFSLGYMLWPLTDKGLALVRYLKGLKMYIEVAEKDRLKMLQSPEGAAKVSVDVNDGKQLVKLYERVLPYAILFGQEAEWNKQLGHYYEANNSSPDWYAGAAGATAFNASSFTSAMNSFSSSAASSSGSSGSSGGGSSGGGGGGGGGGGC